MITNKNALYETENYYYCGEYFINGSYLYMKRPPKMIMEKKIWA